VFGDVILAHIALPFTYSYILFPPSVCIKCPVLGGTRPETCRYYKLNKGGQNFL